MAKPIKSTPELKGEDANRFLERMISTERARITSKQKMFAKELKRDMEDLLVC